MNQVPDSRSGMSAYRYLGLYLQPYYTLFVINDSPICSMAYLYTIPAVYRTNNGYHANTNGMDKVWAGGSCLSAAAAAGSLKARHDGSRR